MSRICDVLAADHVVRFTRLSGYIFAYCKQSKTRAREGLRMRLVSTGWAMFLLSYANSLDNTSFTL